MPAYVWCFSHGQMHDFDNLKDAWCTASWVDLGTRNAASAERIKTAHFGDARFMHELPQEAQEAVQEQVEQRQASV